ncbi:hypothetical protein PV326_013291 [Microctonus aethiopoides]|nr:hypothetical protein PV326_013291 [Microctonus aethiopoides]
MGSQSEDINCKNTMALINTPKCNMFIFDVTLEISYVTDENALIAIKLFEKFLELKPSSTEWKGTISVAGQFYHKNSTSAVYSEIIYDWFLYDGFMTVPELPKGQHKSPSVCLQYTIKFLLNPALPIAQHIYCAKGYEKIPLIGRWTVDDINKYMNIIKEKVDHEKEYNHLEIWQKAWNAYKPPASFNSMRRIH